MASKNAVTLLNDATGDGDWMYWAGGMGEFRVEAEVWGGGNVALQVKGPGGAEQEVDPQTTLTDDGGAIFILAPGQIRAVATTATGVRAVAIRVPA